MQFCIFDHITELSVTYKKAIVYVNFVTNFGDPFQNKLWGICNDLNRVTYLSSASVPNDDGINMVAIVLLMDIYLTAKETHIIQCPFNIRNSYYILP